MPHRDDLSDEDGPADPSGNGRAEVEASAERAFRRAVARHLAATLTGEQAEALDRLRAGGATAEVVGMWLEIAAPRLPELLGQERERLTRRLAEARGDAAKDRSADAARPATPPARIPRFLRLCALAHEAFDLPPAERQHTDRELVLSLQPCRLTATLGPAGETIRILAIVLPAGTEVSANLAAYLLRAQGRLPFGRFLPDHADGLVFEHAVPWDGLTARTLRATADQLTEVAFALRRNLLAAGCITEVDA